jgi:hypothetical protein
MGAIWRVQDRNNFEEFYVRPHQSGNPDANQYEPVFNGVSAWQLYHGDGYGAPVRYVNNQWNRVRILVSDMSAEVYINDLEQPALFVNELRRLKKAGKVGLSVGDFAPAYFSNFSFASARPTLKGKAKPPAAITPGTVMEWMVSNAFDAKMLGGKYELTPADAQPLKWTKLNSENTGLANLAMVQGVTDQANTVFARLRIQSETDQTKTLRFGFSDSVKVYFNNRLVFGGNDTYRTRDYRFLGTIGFFDELYLPLKRGENEVLFAVTEDFGGWGLMARFDDIGGIRLIN